MCHFKKGTDICCCGYNNTILSVRLNRARVVVCVENELFVHNIRDMVILHSIKDTPANPSGLFALAPNSDNCYLAYPGSSTTGKPQNLGRDQFHILIPDFPHDLFQARFNCLTPST